MALTSVALDSARAYLNDTGKRIWTDVKLLPYLKEAHRDLQLQVWLHGIPVLNEKAAASTITAGDTTLTLPSDFVEPIRLKEGAVGDTVDNFVDMIEKSFEPDDVQTTELRYWAYREEQVQLIGATADRDVILYYYKGLTLPTSAASQLGLTFGEMFIGPQTAGYAAGATGNTTLASELLFVSETQLGIAGSKLDAIIRANTKGMQTIPTRRKPYRSSRRFIF